MPSQTDQRNLRSLVGRTFLANVLARATAIVTTIAVLFLVSNPSSTLGLSGPKHPDRKVALVTGANKGIGYEIARKLVNHYHSPAESGDDTAATFCVLLGCRNRTLGEAAAESLRAEARASAPVGVESRVDPVVEVVAIDLFDHETIDRAVAQIEETYGRCDVLINNAAVCYNDPTLYGTVPHTPFSKQAEITVATNFFGTLALTRAMLPLLLRATKGTPRIINIASSAGRLSILPSEDRRAAFSSESLTLDELGSYMTDFVEAAREGRHREEGWPNTGYGVSKVGIIAMTRILAREHGGERGADGRRILVHSVDPGYCATDQNNNQGFIPASAGAYTPYLLATLDADRFAGASGRHWYEASEIAW